MEWLYQVMSLGMIKLIGGVTVLGGSMLATRKAWKTFLRPTLQIIREKEERNVRIDGSLQMIVASQAEIKQHIESHAKDIHFIKKEVMPNGGSSLKDVVNGLSQNVKFLMVRGQAHFAVSHTPMYECDGKGNCISINNQYRELTGLSSDEAYGTGWINAIAEEDRKRIAMLWKQSVENDREFHAVYQMVTKSGEKIKVSGHAIISRDERTNVINHIVGVVNPIV